MKKRKPAWITNGGERGYHFLAGFLYYTLAAFLLVLIVTITLSERKSASAQQRPTQEATTLALEKARLERDKLLEEVKKLREENASSVTMGKTRLESEKLKEEIAKTQRESEKLKEEIAKTQRENKWYWVLISAFGSSSLLVAAVGGILGLRHWNAQKADEDQKRRADRNHEQKIKAEERFQTVIAGLSASSLEQKVGSVVTLRTFLHKEYSEFHSQVFDLVVSHLQLLQSGINAPPPSPVLEQALAVVLKEAIPLVRDGQSQRHPYARGIQLSGVYLTEADLRGVWMPEANLQEAHLQDAILDHADLSNVQADKVDLRGAHLEHANLSNAHMDQANLQAAILDASNLAETTLRMANLKNAHLRGADLTGAILLDADVAGADFSDARLENTNLDRSSLTQPQVDSIASGNAKTILPDGLYLPDSKLTHTTVGP
jgi:hypothetical protein